MFDKMLNMIKNRDILVPRLLLLNYKSMDINDQELIVLIYLINIDHKIYNPKEISNDLKIELFEVLTIISNLTEKGVLTIEMTEKGTMKAEVINLDQLYDKLTFLVVNEEEEPDTSIYSVFEKEFARSLSPVEYEIINTWKEYGFSDELISEALKEAVYNGVSSLKYIDKILDEWKKKGITDKAGVEKSRKKFQDQKNKKKIQTDVFSYDWLNDEE